MEDLEQTEEERENYYGCKCSEMEEFKNAAERYAVEIRRRVEELRRRRDEVLIRLGMKVCARKIWRFVRGYPDNANST